MINAENDNSESYSKTYISQKMLSLFAYYM